MKNPLNRRSGNSLRGAKKSGRVSRAKPRRRPLCLEALEGRAMLSLTPQMLLDINANTPSSNPSGMMAIGSTAYFTADDGVHGVELWKSDGTAAGTGLVKDIFASGGSSPRGLTNVNGTLFFTANDGTRGDELWKSDGTAAGTVLVKDIHPGSYSSYAADLTNVNGTLFFTAYTHTKGAELWKSDGTAAGTVLVKDINPGTSFTDMPSGLTNVNGTLFFTATNGTTGYVLWKSNGTAAGTVMVNDIFSGNLANVNGTLFFIAIDTTVELWKSDGTAAGTVLVKQVPDSTNTSLTTVNGTMFWTAEDDTNGKELWKSDGTAAGTTLVKDIDPGQHREYDNFGNWWYVPNGSFPFNLTNVNGTLFFTAYNHTNGGELWKSDGTAAGTTLVKDIVASGDSWPGQLTNVNGTLFFTANNGATGYELWKSDGTAAGTVLVKDIYPGIANVYAGPSNLTNVNGTLFFAGSNGATGFELWKSDGTAAGTTLVKDVNSKNLNSNPANQIVVDGTLFFAADDGMHGSELWKSDGTAAGTVLVKDITPGSHMGHYGDYEPNSSSPNNLTNVNGTLYFVTSSARGLWKSDGTEAGTVLVKDIYLGGRNSYPGNLTNVNGTLFFTAFDDTNGRELWKSDGTTSGTTLVKDIFPGGMCYPPYGCSVYGSDPGNLTNVNGTLFFTAYNDTNGRELWKSDGTEAGTVLVKDIYPGGSWGSFAYYGNSSSPSTLTNVNGTLFFSANNATSGNELWKSDGTSAGTVLVQDINPGDTSSYPSALTNVNGTLFFNAQDATTGYELWKSNGSAAGTVRVTDINLGSASSDPGNLTNVNGTLFFSANNATTGHELWKSNGTAAGTLLVKDMNPGGTDSFPGNLTNVNGTLFFTADYGTGARNLWQSDGTTAGTVVVTSLVPNALTNFNGTLYFTADDGIRGKELWKLVDGPTLALSGLPATVTAGVAKSFTVTAKNADGTTNTNYRGTVQFTSSDPQAVLPGNYTFTAADQGVHTFSATLKTAGGQSITISDTAVPFGAVTQSGITVNPAAASSFTVAGFPAPVTAGVAGSFTVTARDAYGNRANGYTGTVRFTSSDPQAVLPGNYIFTAADAGVRTFSATLKTAGNQVLTTTDTANAALTGAQGSIQVNPAAASRLMLIAPASVKANTAFSLTVRVVDAYGNVITGYRGTLGFSSSDATANLPKKYTFTAADQGVHTFTGLRLKKKGTQTITITDKLNTSLAGSAIIQVL